LGSSHSDAWHQLAREFRVVDPDQRIRVVYQPNGNNRWTVLGDRGFPQSRLTQFTVLAKRAGSGLLVSPRVLLDDAWFDALKQRYPDISPEAAFGNVIMHASDKSAEMCSALEAQSLEDERIQSSGSALPHADSTPGTSVKRSRIPGTVTSRVAADRAQQFMQSKGWTQKEFGRRSNHISDRTIRSFFKTGTIRKGLLADIAKAMKTDVDTLLNPLDTGGK
jgi:hypothetical protein